MFLALAVLACVIPAQASAASNPSVPDVPASFWAHAQITWSVKAGWVPLHKNGTFAPAHDATRTAAARVLASLNMLIMTAGGFDFTGSDCIGWIRDAGFHGPRTEPLTPEISMVVGIK
jgi:hypothetical protein